MNPTNESIGRASEILRMVVDGRISGRISEWPQLKWACEKAARELDRQAPGESAHFVALQEILAAHANDDVRPKAFYIAADALAAPQPPAQEQGEVLDTLPDAAKWKAMPLHERLNIHAEGCALVCDESKDAVLSTHEIRAMHDDIREAIATLTRAAGAEDARDAVAMMERWQSVWEDCNEIACNTGSDMIHRRAMQVLSYLDDHEPGKLERDAARYRFLRDVADNKDRVPFIAKRDSWCVSAWNGEAADTSIDQAIASQAKEGANARD